MNKEKVTIKISSDDNRSTDITLKFNYDGDEMMECNMEFDPPLQKTDLSSYAATVYAIAQLLTDTE